MTDRLLYNLIHLTSKQTQSSWALISTKSLWAYTEIFNSIVSAEDPTLKLGKKELICFGLETSQGTFLPLTKREIYLEQVKLLCQE